jgi:hypothetical protein
VTTTSSVLIVLMELLEKGHAFKDGFSTRRFSRLYGSIPFATITKQLEEEGHEHHYPRLRLILNVHRRFCSWQT